MNREERELEAQIEQLLADPQYQGHPLHDALHRLYVQHREHLDRLERIARISDGYQHMARQDAHSLSERYHRQLRQLEKVARISDRYQQMMQDLNQALQEASSRDALTGLANRRLMMERLREETERASRHPHPYVLAMLDVDHFKDINDQHGHDAGDQVLIELSRAMQAALRDYDLCSRWGGEEFLILLPDTVLADARQVVERVRQTIRSLPVDIGSQVLSVSCSVGLTEHQCGENYSSTINRADAALLAAKRAGRDRSLEA
ncbi:biofilm regulation diguanylate cyclase SiaD [Chitinimonas sp.]|uniref:biofilm regulation diguanylate cyclase SiaD n=1 Tax=Chitinimonas sp. TaxID=1934313 RepID=UPI0035B0CD7E